MALKDFIYVEHMDSWIPVRLKSELARDGPRHTLVDVTGRHPSPLTCGGYARGAQGCPSRGLWWLRWTLPNTRLAGDRQIDSPGTPGKPKSQTKNRHVPNSSFISLTLGKEQWLGEQRGGAAREGATEKEPHGVVPRACVSIALSRSS